MLRLGRGKGRETLPIATKWAISHSGAKGISAVDYEAMTTQKPIYPDPPLTDGTIRVRPWTMHDLPAVEQASQDTYITSVTSVPSTYTESEGTAFIERQWERIKSDAGLSLCIADAHTDTALGYVGLRFRLQGRASFGYWVVPDARGRGIATAAVRLVTLWAFSALGVARLEILVEPWNTGSIRVAEQAVQLQ